MKTLIPLALLVSAVLPTAATLAPTPAHAGDWGGLYSAVTRASDYRYQGVSESRGRPVVQGYVHWYRPDGYFAGVFGTQLDFGYQGAPTYEIDAYAGKNFRLGAGKTELKLQAMYTTF